MLTIDELGKFILPLLGASLVTSLVVIALAIATKLISLNLKDFPKSLRFSVIVGASSFGVFLLIPLWLTEMTLGWKIFITILSLLGASLSPWAIHRMAMTMVERYNSLNDIEKDPKASGGSHGANSKSKADE